MIHVRALSKRYGTLQAVDGVTFQAENGSITGLLGPNGAGKTTTLRMLSTLVRPDSGEALIDGVDVARSPRAALARLGVLPDGRGLYPRLTAREHLEYFGALHGLPAPQLRERIEHLVALLDMHDIIDRRVLGFSQGERTKVAIARAIVHGPSNVVLDEATNGLDVMSTRAMRGVIRELAAQGKTVLFSSHVMQEVSELCDHIVVFSSGRVVADGAPDALRRQTGESNLEEAFVKIIGTGSGLA
jgi:sodium transport system ATP-binding protein